MPAQPYKNTTPASISGLISGLATCPRRDERAELKGRAEADFLGMNLRGKWKLILLKKLFNCLKLFDAKFYISYAVILICIGLITTI